MLHTICVLLIPEESNCAVNNMPGLALRRGDSILLVAIAVTFLIAIPSVAAKRLVLIAGPRQEGIQDFFYQHATDSEGSSESLSDWSWPTVRDEDYELLLRESAAGTNVSRRNIFHLLFEEQHNSVVQQVLMQAIRESWDNSVNGIVLGEERLGTVGVDQYTSDDALKIIVRVMENLSITAKDVTLVLMYGTPRIQQWASIWHRESRYETYYNFLCKSDEDSILHEHLDTTMNPFRVAKSYRGRGWNVAVVDEEGARRAGSDPAHAISCDILDVNCENGWVAGLKAEASRGLPLYEINELDEDEKQELEELFLLRDCLYKQDFDNGTNEFQILSRELVWRNCRNQHEPELKEMLDDTDFFLDVIQSQQGCGSDVLGLSDVLASADSPSFATILWLMIIASSFCLVGVSVLLVVRFAREKKINFEFDGVLKIESFWEKKSANSKPTDSTDHRRSQCNACKFVRFDPNCIYCDSGNRVASSEIGKEVERRIKQQRNSGLLGVTDQTKKSMEVEQQVSRSPASYSDEPKRSTVRNMPLSTNNIYESTNSVDMEPMRPTTSMAFGNSDSDSYVDTSHFDMNLRKTRDQNKGRRKKKEKEKKSQVVNKLKELMVLRTEDGRRVYSIGELSSSHTDDNLQTISCEQEDKLYCYV